MDRALAIDPENARALEARGLILLRRGQEAKEKGDAAAALRFLESSETATRSALAQSEKILWGGVNLANTISERAKLTDPPDPTLMAQAVAQYQTVLDRFEEIPKSGVERDVYIGANANLCDAQIALRRLQEALATCSRITEISPDDPLGFYNLAGAHALLGNRDAALAALAKDAELGDSDWEYLSSDPWFEKLRQDPRFASIVAEMKRKAG